MSIHLPTYPPIYYFIPTSVEEAIYPLIYTYIYLPLSLYSLFKQDKKVILMIQTKLIKVNMVGVGVSKGKFYL